MTGISVQLSASEPSSTSDQDNVLIKNLIRDSLDQKLDSRRKQKTQNELHETLVAVIEEFCSCFMIVGFDLDNQPVVLSKAPSPMEGEALISLVKKVFADVTKK